MRRFSQMRRQRFFRIIRRDSACHGVQKDARHMLLFFFLFFMRDILRAVLDVSSDYCSHMPRASAQCSDRPDTRAMPFYFFFFHFASAILMPFVTCHIYLFDCADAAAAR